MELCVRSSLLLAVHVRVATPASALRDQHAILAKRLRPGPHTRLRGSTPTGGRGHVGRHPWSPWTLSCRDAHAYFRDVLHACAKGTTAYAALPRAHVHRRAAAAGVAAVCRSICRGRTWADRRRDGARPHSLRTSRRCLSDLRPETALHATSYAGRSDCVEARTPSAGRSHVAVSRCCGSCGQSMSMWIQRTTAHT
eukprot:355982-Chlamydomonas_euryale.AAC.9